MSGARRAETGNEPAAIGGYGGGSALAMPAASSSRAWLSTEWTGGPGRERSNTRWYAQLRFGVR